MPVKEQKAYRRWYILLKILVTLVFKPKIKGREHIPSGAFIVCANHTSFFDGLLLVDIFPRDAYVRVLTKKEVFEVPVLGAFMRSVGMIRVDRSISDMAPVRESLAHLKAGGVVAIFPEGHRVSEEESSAAKSGAVKLAEKLQVPILPMHIPRKKRLIFRTRVTIGEPYFIKEESRKLQPEEFDRLTNELMQKISALSAEGN